MATGYQCSLRSARCTGVRLKLPAHCVRFGMRTGSACCAAFGLPDATPAKPYKHRSVANIRAIPFLTCHFLNARLTAANASTCLSAARSFVAYAQLESRSPGRCLERKRICGGLLGGPNFIERVTMPASGTLEDNPAPAINVRFRDKSGHHADTTQCLLMLGSRIWARHRTVQPSIAQ